jgi:Ca2+-binding RTX toxin-like protein
LLQDFAQSPDFAARMKVAFGEEINVADLQAAWQSGDMSRLPEIEVRPAAQINGANGAYAQAVNVIYLSQEFLDQNANNIEPIAGVFLEEIGHFVDAQLNPDDSPGDEGAIFSAMVRGETLSPEQLLSLKAEDDKATVTLDGQVLQIEQDNIVGTEGNDVLNGTTGNDTIDGLGGNDTIYGLDGGDQLIGSTGDDSLYGEAGDDTLDGGEGDDYLLPGPGVNAVIGGAGSDRLDLDYSTATADLTVNYSNANNGTISDGSTLKEVEMVVLTSGAGNDTIDISATTVESYIEGGAGDDLITGGSGYRNRLAGGAGNDTIYGGANHDTPDWNNGGLYGGEGNDTLYGLGGNDALYGEAGDDTLDGGDGDDGLSGGEGNDTLDGGEGHDGLAGEAGDDTLYGGDGYYDYLSGGEGNDTVYGGGATTTCTGRPAMTPWSESIRIVQHLALERLMYSPAIPGAIALS